MTTEYQTEFLERLPRTPAANSYRFIRPEGLTFIAGQYMLVDLGGELLHPLSLSDCPEEAGFIEFTKRMTGSPYCQRLETLTKGEKISVRGPDGKFTLGADSGNIIMIAGGIGITPIRSILKSHERQAGAHCRIILVYGNNDQNDIAFRAELENLQLPDYKVVHVLLDTTGLAAADKGFITADIIARESLGREDATYMISGPPGMVKAIEAALVTINVPENRICTDVFLGYD
jgi:ferredoxin-NADP reductase